MRNSRVRSSLPVRTWRNRRDNAVWPWQQARVRRAVDRAFAAPSRLATAGSVDLNGVLPDPQDTRPLVLACCDERYFDRFAAPLAASAQRNSPQTRLHIHLFAPPAGAEQKLAALRDRHSRMLTISHEDERRIPSGGDPRFFFAAGRFAVAARLREMLRSPILLIDADGLIARDLTRGFAGLEHFDAGFILRPREAALYRRVLASAIYIGASAAAEGFFGRFADAIELLRKTAPQFHIDQLGLWFALQRRDVQDRLRIASLGSEWSDFHFAPESLIWSAKGGRKLRFEELESRLLSGA